MKNINKTAIGVALFILILIAFGYSEKSSGDQSIQIGLGSTVINSDLKVGEIGYEINNWEFQAGLMDNGDTKNGYQDQLEIYSVSYITKPDWDFKGVEPYARLGISYNSGSELVGDSNFRLGLGLDFHDVWRVEFSHHSSAGIHDTNTGIDQITLSRKFTPFWE